MKGGSLGAVLALILVGAGWGITIPLTKVVVSTGYQPFGLIFWQMVIGAVITFALLTLRGKRPFQLTRAQLGLCGVIALIGTLLPNGVSYQVAVHLPAAVLSIVLSLIPMIAFPIALVMRNDRFSVAKLVGLALGLAGVVVLGQRDGALMQQGLSVVWLVFALVAPTFYAFEANLVNRTGTFGLDPVHLLFGASVIGAAVCLPLALATGQFISPIRPYGVPEIAHVFSSVAHVLVYAGYLWLVGRAGAVFAAQVSYLVTIFGVTWAMVLLGEHVPPQLWMALGLAMSGLFLVQPRKAGDTDAPQFS
ncbi:MAG: DMT family transporter [Pseudomonadota bacterium]